MSTYDAWPTKYNRSDIHDVPRVLGHVFESALSDSAYLDEMIDLGILTKPTSLETEAFVWEKARQLCCHEQSIFTLVEKYPSMPCPKLLGFLKMCPPSNLSREPDPSFQFGAVFMEYFPGITLGAVLPELIFDENWKVTIPESARELLPNTTEAGEALHDDMNIAIQSMASIGLQTVDYQDTNVFLHEPSDGQRARLKWVDLGAFQPLKWKSRLSPGFLPLSDDTCFVQEVVEAHSTTEWLFSGDLTSLTRYCDISQARRRASFLNRYKSFSSSPDATFAWRVIMESVCFVRGDNPALSVPILVAAIMATNSLSFHEGQIHPYKTFWARKVIKTGRLLAAEETNTADITQSDLDTLNRFEEIIRQSGRLELLDYTEAEPVPKGDDSDDDDSDDDDSDDDDWWDVEEVKHDFTGTSNSDVVQIISQNAPIFGDFWGRVRNLPDAPIIDDLQKRTEILKTIDLSWYTPGMATHRP